MKKIIFLLTRGLPVLAALLAGRPLSAQTEDPPVGVAVKIYVRGQGYGGSVSLFGNFLESSPGAGDGYATNTGYADGSGNALAVLGTPGFVRVVPGVIYPLSVSGSNVVNDEADIVAPPGYRVIMDQMVRSRETFSGSATILFQLQSLGARHPGLAGMASSVASSDVDWRISLGSLRNGGSAGDLALVDPGTSSSWSALFTPGPLFYQPVSDEISVYNPSNILRQIVANQVVVDIVTLTSSSYEIRCYHPTQMQGSSAPYTFSGQAYATYRIEQGATATTLKFTKEIRNVIDAYTTTLPVARREIMSLSRTGTWPAYVWTRSDWSVDSQPPLTETDVTGGGTTAARTEAITVHTPGLGGAVALNVTRNYSVPTFNNQSTIGEVLASETVGTGTNLTASFNYYADPSKFGSLGYLKSATLPGGTWVAYDYYDSDLTNGFRGGRVKYRYKPYLNAPATISQTASLGEVTYYEYVNDFFGAPTRSSLVQTTVNGTMTAKTTTTYNDSFSTANGFAITQSTRADSADASNTLSTVTTYYRDDASDAFIRGQTYSVTNPDAVKQSFAYQRGTWDGTTFTVGSGNIGTGTASRVSVITGSNNSSAGTSYASVDSYQLDTVYLVDGKSTKSVTIRDSRALVARTESYTWSAGAWQLVSWTNYVYDFGGRLTSRTANNGATYTATYDGGLKTSETDEAGVVTNYTYDASGQVSTSTRAGSGAIGALATHFVYDAAGHVVQQQVGWGQTEQIVTAKQYDDAGRVTVETPSGGLGSTTHSYDAANRTHTVTRPTGGGASTIATNLDGSAASTTGTATIASYHTYGIETDGRHWHQVNSGAAASPRWQKSWTDWLGRTVQSEHPGFTGQVNIDEFSTYETGTGHLIKTTKTGYAPTLYQYNSLGQVNHSGLDVNNTGLLDLASNDRITDTDTYLESYSGGWWTRTDTHTYPKAGLGTVVLASVSRTRLTGFPTNRLSESQSVDAEGNLTIQTVDANRSAATSIATTTKTGISGSQVENTLNGYSINVTGFDGLTTTTAYDSLLRRSSVTDSRKNTTTTTYLTGTSLPVTVTDMANYTSATYYDTLGRVSWQRDQRNFYTRYEYNTRDQVIHTWGDGTMPVAYGYDCKADGTPYGDGTVYGDRTTMSTYRGGTGWTGTTWPSSPGTADTTTWAYDPPSGLLTTKTDAPTSDSGHANGCSVTQTYNLRGQTATRTLARGVTTTYGYDNNTGELLTQTYSDSTPAVTYTYGRTGQVETVADVTGVRDMIYDALKPWRLTAEAESAFYGGRVMSRMYDETGVIGRVHGFQVGSAAGDNDDLEQTFGFTTVGRFETLVSKRNANATSRTFRYTYRSDSALLQSLSIDGNSPFSVTRSYDGSRNLITAVDSKWSTASQTRYDFVYDERAQRTSTVQSGAAFADYGDSTFHLYTYDGRGEVTADVGYLGTGVTNQSNPLPYRRHEYAYDNAENRTSSNRSGISGLADTYATNALNQYTSRTNNTVPVSGTAAPDTGGAGGTAVSVGGGTLAPAAAARQGNYWADEITVANTVSPWRGSLTVFTAKRGTGGSPDAYRADTRMVEAAALSQTLTYDLDGNLLSDGLVTYTWDAENRLTRMETDYNAYTLYGFPHRAIDFRYDYMGRRVQKRVYDVDQNQEVSSRRYLYDGWNLIAEYAAPGGTTIGTLLRSYTWGLDIALSQTNAGGVGALLQIADHPTGKTYLPTYDGNGNIVSLLNADTGALAAVYEYSPFGEPLRAQTLDPVIADNPWRFSTKFTDLETGLSYYGLRYYNPKDGRFINKDPKEEAGGLNLYGFCGNDGVNHWDVLGMDPGGVHMFFGVAHPEWSDAQYWMNVNLSGQHGNSGIYGSENLSGLSGLATSDGMMNSGNFDWDTTRQYFDPNAPQAGDSKSNTQTKTYVVDGKTYIVTNDTSSAPEGATLVGGATVALVTTTKEGQTGVDATGPTDVAPTTVSSSGGLDPSLVTAALAGGLQLASNNDGMFTDGSIPFVTKGGGSEAAAVGEAGASTLNIAATPLRSPSLGTFVASGMNPGDVVLYSGNNRTQTIVGAVTNSDYGHAAIALTGGTVLTARPGDGVTIDNTPYGNVSGSNVVILRPPGSVNTAALIQFAHEYVHYNPGYTIPIAPLNALVGVTEYSQPICSTPVVLGLRAGGVLVPPNVTTPGDLANLGYTQVWPIK